MFGTTALTYNTESVKPKPDSWAACWDKNYAKKLSMNELAWYRVFTTALYLGEDPNNVKDWNRLWNAVRDQHKLVLKYWSSGMEMQQLFTNREIYLGEFWSGRTLNLKDKGVPVGEAVGAQFLALKEAEWAAWSQQVTAWELAQYADAP